MRVGQKTRGWTRRQALWLMTGATGGLVLHGLTQKANTTSSTKAVAAAPKNIIGKGYTPLHVALENGYLKEGDLNLIYRDFSSDTNTNASKAGHSKEKSLVKSEVVSFAPKGVSHQIIMATDNFFGGDRILLNEQCHWLLKE